MSTATDATIDTHDQQPATAAPPRPARRWRFLRSVVKSGVMDRSHRSSATGSRSLKDASVVTTLLRQMQRDLLASEAGRATVVRVNDDFECPATDVIQAAASLLVSLSSASNPNAGTSNGANTGGATGSSAGQGFARRQEEASAAAAMKKANAERAAKLNAKLVAEDGGLFRLGDEEEDEDDDEEDEEGDEDQTQEPNSAQETRQGGGDEGRAQAAAAAAAAASSSSSPAPPQPKHQHHPSRRLHQTLAAKIQRQKSSLAVLRSDVVKHILSMHGAMGRSFEGLLEQSARAMASQQASMGVLPRSFVKQWTARKELQRRLDAELSVQVFCRVRPADTASARRRGRADSGSSTGSGHSSGSSSARATAVLTRRASGDFGARAAAVVENKLPFIVSTEEVKGTTTTTATSRTTATLSSKEDAEPGKRFRVSGFAGVLGPAPCQGLTFEKAVRPLLPGALDGAKSTVLCYGMTGAGKTHTLLGSPDHPGMLQRALLRLAFLTSNASSDWFYSISVSAVDLAADGQVFDILAAGDRSSGKGPSRGGGGSGDKDEDDDDGGETKVDAAAAPGGNGGGGSSSTTAGTPRLHSRRGVLCDLVDPTKTGAHVVAGLSRVAIDSAADVHAFVNNLRAKFEADHDVGDDGGGGADSSVVGFERWARPVAWIYVLLHILGLRTEISHLTCNHHISHAFLPPTSPHLPSAPLPPLQHGRSLATKATSSFPFLSVVGASTNPTW